MKIGYNAYLLGCPRDSLVKLAPGPATCTLDRLADLDTGGSQTAFCEAQIEKGRLVVRAKL